MSPGLDDLVRLLTLERTSENRFLGQSQDLGWGHVYGGQVLGQALSAAVQTVPEERGVHSLQAYFLRPGDVNRPIVYEVDRIREGASFTTRRVVAIQGGHAIFNLAASFQRGEAGFEHQDTMPDVPLPESLPTEEERIDRFAQEIPQPLLDHLRRPRPFETRTTDPLEDPRFPLPRAPRRTVWLRTRGELPVDPAIHRCLLAYASDGGLLLTALLPHGVSWLTSELQIASLDHVMWFHRPFRIDEWLLYVMESPNARDARALVHGRIFTTEGRLVASTSQEGLIRPRSRQPLRS